MLTLERSACVSSGVSFYYRILLIQGVDYSWNITKAAILTLVSRSHGKSYSFLELTYSRAVELDVGIICACLPHLPPLFRRLREKYSVFSSEQLKPRNASKIWKRIFTSGPFSKRNSKQLDPEAHNDSKEMYLETNIIGSQPGEGKFLGSGIHPWHESSVEFARGREEQERGSPSCQEP